MPETKDKPTNTVAASSSPFYSPASPLTTYGFNVESGLSGWAIGEQFFVRV
jgi:hypothetical protein